MTKLEDIPVRVEFDRPGAAKPDIVNQLLRDIQAGLTDLLANGQVHAIDLRQLPRMSAEVYQALRDALGQGEVSAVIQAQVKIEIAETQYPGVWWLRHFNARDEITTEILEITEMPVILKPHPVDMRSGLQKLGERLQPDVRPTAPAGLPA